MDYIFIHFIFRCQFIKWKNECNDYIFTNKIIFAFELVKYLKGLKPFRNSEIIYVLCNYNNGIFDQKQRFLFKIFIVSTLYTIYNNNISINNDLYTSIPHEKAGVKQKNYSFWFMYIHSAYIWNAEIKFWYFNWNWKRFMILSYQLISVRLLMSWNNIWIHNMIQNNLWFQQARLFML